VIGMASLEARLAQPGTRVEVAVADGSAGAMVEPLPVYDTEKRRPRS
jgi:glycine cleavage system aminomethyltransferase T